MKYESELIHEILEQRGHEKSSLHYKSECVESWVDEAKGAYPKLCDYESEWLNYINEKPIGEFPYETVTANNTATANHVVPLAYKSAILKGQTLVNLVKTSVYVGVQNGTCVDGDYPYKVVESIVGVGASILTRFQTIYPLSPSTVYYLKLTDVAHTNAFLVREHDNGKNLITEIHDLENKIIKFTTSELGTSDLFFYQQQLQVGARVKYSENFIISNDVESLYSADDYFTGMQSVKMPVLTTTGKNLFNGVLFDGRPTDDTPNMAYKNTGLIEVKSNESYAIQSDGKMDGVNFYNENKEVISTARTPYTTTTIITPEKCKYISVQLFQRDEAKIQIEEGTQATTYEPYKSNILTVNEPIELHGIGDVQDTLDCLTGEVTQRIGEIVLDNTLYYEHCWGGSRDTETHYVIGAKVNNHLWNVNNEERGSLIKCDKLRTRGITSSNGYGFFLFYVSKSILGEELTNAKIREYILSLNTTVQYPLATPTIKTVDLTITNQDGETLNNLKPIEGTMHIEVSGTPINPKAVLEIPVEAITQNLNSFIEEE